MRSNPATKSTAPAPMTRAQLAKQIASLERQDRALLEEQLALEGAGVVPRPEAHPDVVARTDAEALLAGGDATVPSADPSVRLHSVIRMRAAIKIAVELGQGRLQRIMAAESRTIATDLEEAWRANIDKVCGLILELQALGAARDRLLAEWRARVGLPVTPACAVACERFVPAKLVPDSLPYAVLQQAARAQYITRVV
jgi:hypothetical protein